MWYDKYKLRERRKHLSDTYKKVNTENLFMKFMSDISFNR